MSQYNEMIHMLSSNMGSELTPLQNVMVQINYFINHGDVAFSYLSGKGIAFRTVLDTRILQFGEELVDYLETHEVNDLNHLESLYETLVKCSSKRQNASSIGGRL